MAAATLPLEARPDWQQAAAGSLGAAQDVTRDAIERAQLAAAVQGAAGLPAVLADAAAHVDPGAGTMPQPAVLRAGDPSAALILAQDATALGGLGGLADDAAGLGRGVAGGLRAATPLGALMLGAHGAETLQGWTEDRAVGRSAEALRFDLGTAEGVVGARHHAFAHGAWGLELAFPSVAAGGEGAVGTASDRREVAPQALSLFALAHPEAAARAGPGNEAHRAMTAWMNGSMAALDEGRLRVSDEGWAEGWREVFPALDDEGRRLGQLGGFGAGVQAEQGWLETFPAADPEHTGPHSTAGAAPAVLDDPLITVPESPEIAGDWIVTMDPSSAQPPRPDRHDATRIGERSRANEVNTVWLPGVDVQGDVEAIRAGEAERVGDRFVVNGRSYGYHSETGRLFPDAGEGLVKLDRGGFKALGILNDHGDTPEGRLQLERNRITDEALEQATEVWEQLR